jgi:hypothetical protein
MAKKSNLVKWIIASGAALFLAVLVHSSLQQTHYRYEVCVDFRGQRHCATSDGATREDAIRSAHDIDCAIIAPGRDATMACHDTDASSVREIR